MWEDKPLVSASRTTDVALINCYPHIEVNLSNMTEHNNETMSMKTEQHKHRNVVINASLSAMYCASII